LKYLDAKKSPLSLYSKGKKYLVGGIPTPLKNRSSSAGMMTFPIYGKIKAMFESTNGSFTSDFIVDLPIYRYLSG